MWRDRSWVQRGVGIVVTVVVLGFLVITLSGDGGNETQLLDAAIDTAEEGRFDDAVTSLTELIELAPDDPEILALAYVNRSVYRANLGRLGEAMTDATAAIELAPDDPEILALAYVNRSVNFLALGRDREAVTDASLAIELDPPVHILAQAYFNRAFALSGLGWDAEALADATAAIEFEPDDPDLVASAYLIRGFALSGLGRDAEALADATAAIELEPDDRDILARAYVNRSTALRDLGRFDEAIAEATVAIELEPDDPDTLARAHLGRSFSLGELGRSEEAIPDATAVIDLEPDDIDMLAEAHVNRSFDLANLGRHEEAMADATAAIGLSDPPSDFKVGFIGDQGSGDDARAVLELIRDEGAAMVLHQGDFDYDDDPLAWDNLITDVLGLDFPYFASVGNHDEDAWRGSDGYQAELSERLSRIRGAACTGDLGIRSTCIFGGLYFILSGVGTMGSDHATYIADQLAQAPSRWRICSWHKNQTAMQVGDKGDSTGWDVYERCREGGAIIATAHAHSYSRTKTLTDVSSQSVDEAWSQPDEVRVGSGSTFVFVSGLGGRSIRDQLRCLPSTPPYGCDGEWAHVYTSDQIASSGALFCAFNADGDEDSASCYFKDINGNVPDTFSVTNFNE